MGLHKGVLAEIRHGVEVEVEGFSRQDRVAGERAVPGTEQGCNFLRSNARGILRQEALLRNDVEATEQAEAIIGNERHDVALALDRPELEREGGQQGLQG